MRRCGCFLLCPAHTDFNSAYPVIAGNKTVWTPIEGAKVWDCIMNIDAENHNPQIVFCFVCILL